MSTLPDITLRKISDNLTAKRYETVRRQCLAALADQTAHPNDSRWCLFEALCRLGDLAEAQVVLKALEPRHRDEALRVGLALAVSYHRYTMEGHYRESAEKQAGLCIDEFVEKYNSMADLHFDEALRLADTPERRELAATALRLCNRDAKADELAPPPAKSAPVPTPVSVGTGTLAGRLRLADGKPAAHVQVTLGTPMVVSAPEVDEFLPTGISNCREMTVHEDLHTVTATTDDEGRYAFADLPARRYAFLAATLDPLEHDIATHYLARDIDVQPGDVTTLDAVVTEWQSAPPAPLDISLPASLVWCGRSLRQLFTQPLRNPFHYAFPRQLVKLPLPAGVDSERLCLVDSGRPGEVQPVQVTMEGEVACMLELPAVSSRLVSLYEADGALPDDLLTSSLALTPTTDGWGEIDTGVATFRVPLGEGEATRPPIGAVRGEDGVWRGHGRWLLPAGVAIARRNSLLLDAGPLLMRLRIDYTLSTGAMISFELTAIRDEPCLLVHEISAPVPGAAFEFSLREFSGGRGFLHWTPEHGNVHWRTLKAEARELARLQESVAWWIPPQGFAYAMTADGLEQEDYIGLFTIRRGDWIDRDFERIAQGPGDENRELDWPYPEMVGSTISMITAHTTADGDAFYRFGCFDGERRWGVLVSTFARNDGPHKELSAVQHKNSSPRLQEFKDWRLDEQDRIQRPFVLTRREKLRELRRKRLDPRFAPIWAALIADHGRGPRRGFQAMIESDPAKLWRLRTDMVIEAPRRARMTLFGRDYSDVYSPVGGRPITPYAEQYDMIAATGVFTAEEERQVRSSLMLMGHMYMETDFMNWRFNSRNANFEADRVDIVGTIGVAFRGNPDAEDFVQHAAELMERSLNVYCTPGSGKWYENPACYYLHAASCRLNLAYHLYQHNLLDVTAIPRLRDFLSWGPLLLTAPYPHDYALLRDGCSYEEYAAAEKVRRVPPIGDHAHVGQWVSEFFALMGKAYRQRDPELADLLAWAYQAGGRNGGHFSKLPMWFCAVEEADLEPVAEQLLASRRLEGFGAIFRGHVGQPNEFYLLFKQGPGGYRYHRTEGSFLLMADGRPLVFDGGEAGETWRHSTLSFHESHMPLAPGHVQRFATLPSADFVQGVHPKALSPSDPVFLSDSCEHQLVDVAWERFREPNPAVVRSILWIKDDYVIVSDDLRLPEEMPTHWHLQVVSDAHNGSAAEGWRFTGRHGVDLQLLLPDLPADARITVRQQPTLEYRLKPEESFAMRHFQASMTAPHRLHALLRPLPPGRTQLKAKAMPHGLHVTGEGIDDHLFFSRDPISVVVGRMAFTGRYGAILRRPGRITLLLLDGTLLAIDSHTLTSNSFQPREAHFLQP